MSPVGDVRDDVVERGSVQGRLGMVLPTWTRKEQRITTLFIKGLTVSTWGWREDLLAIPLGATVQVPWKRLRGRKALYLDGKVVVEAEPR